MTLELRGPLAAWQALRDLGPLGDDATEADRAEIPMFEALALTGFRDFERALLALRRAETLGASPRRVAMAEAHVLLVADRYREALAAAARATAIAPNNPRGHRGDRAAAHPRGDADAGIAVLRRGAACTQAADLVLQLVSMPPRGICTRSERNGSSDGSSGSLCSRMGRARSPSRPTAPTTAGSTERRSRSCAGRQTPFTRGWPPRSPGRSTIPRRRASCWTSPSCGSTT